MLVTEFRFRQFHRYPSNNLKKKLYPVHTQTTYTNEKWRPCVLVNVHTTGVMTDHRKAMQSVLIIK